MVRWPVPQIFMGGVKVQTEITKNIYLIPSINLLAAGHDSKAFWNTLTDFHFSEEVNDSAFYQFGFGLTASYMSLLGPIQVSVSKDQQVGKVRGFFSIGFNL